MQYYAGLQSGWDIIELCSMVNSIATTKYESKVIKTLSEKIAG